MKFHSTVALVTNSSTSIYSTATDSTIKELKKFIDVALKTAGSEKTSDDIFDLSLVVAPESIEMAMDVAFDDDTPVLDWYEHLTPEEIEVVNKYRAADWKTGKQWYDQVAEIISRMVAESHIRASYSDDQTQYAVQILDKQGNKVPENVTSSLEQWAHYD